MVRNLVVRKYSPGGWLRTSLLNFKIVFFIYLICYVNIYAMAPPRPGEMYKYQKDGSLSRRFEFAKKLGNYKVHPDLITRLKAKTEMEKQGREFDKENFPYKTGLPAFGSPKIFVLPIEFPDYPHTQDISRFQTYLFGGGDSDLFPYESLKNFYYRSSYGKLTINGDVMPWYTAPHVRSYYDEDVKPVIKGAIDALKSTVDFSQYDNNNDGKIDYFICYWTGPDTGWGTTFWAWCDVKGNDFSEDSYRVAGKKLGTYSWVWEKNDDEGQKEFYPIVSLHETGHGLGLPDYYDYQTYYGPEGGLGGMDMMDSGKYDHNAFSKFLLGWVKPITIGDNVLHNISLRNSDAHGDAVIIMPGAKDTLLFDEYFVVQNRIRNGNDAPKSDGNCSLPNQGLVIFHVDATLNYDGTDFAHDNSYTTHKLIKLMEADGLEEIEEFKPANSGDFYTEGKSISLESRPNSNSYYNDPPRDGVYVTNISPGWSTRSATFVNPGNVIFESLKEVLDNDKYSFSTGGDNIWYGASASGAANANAAQSGAISDGRETWIKASINAQGTISFRWKVSSQNGDNLSFYIDDVLQDSISGDVDWQVKSYKVIQTGVGTAPHIFEWIYKKNSSGSSGQDRAWLDYVQFYPLSPSLGEALDNTELDWITSGDTGWFGETGDFSYGGSAAKSNSLSDNQSTYIQTQITDSGTLNFIWKSSSELNADFLKFYLDSKLISQISGANSWQTKTFFIRNNGNHDLMWKYQKDAGGSDYYDSGYLDRVEFFPIEEISEAVDNIRLDFTTGGNYDIAKWNYQTNFSYYGGDSAQSGFTSDSGESFIQTIIDAPGYLSFVWKVSSELNHDYLELYKDNTCLQKISGEQDWTSVNDIFISEPCVLKWRYVKDGSGMSNRDCGWVDKIIFNHASDLADAADNHYLPIKTYGDGEWAVDNTVSYFGGSSIKSPKIGYKSSDGLALGKSDLTKKYVRDSSVTTYITGPGTMTFYWKASIINTSSSRLILFIDSVWQEDLSGVVDWQKKTLVLSPGTHWISWDFRYSGYSDTGDDAAWIDKIDYTKNITLNEAIDNSTLVLSTSGNPHSWYGISDSTAYCDTSARSGSTSDTLSSVLETTVNGPKTLNFNWKASSELNKDYLEFYIDNALKDRISGIVDWETKSYLILSGQHKLSWKYHKDASGSAHGDCGWLDKISLSSTPTIAEAVDNSDLVWHTDGNANWLGQIFNFFYDDDAAQTGKISNGQYSRLYTNITGPGILNFYWKVSSNKGVAPLDFFIDGQKWGSISGNVDWQQRTYILETGSHLIEWKYSNSSANIRGANCGWVDKVEWTSEIVPDCQIVVPYDYPTIQEAINAAREGCKIVVFPGTYYENLTIAYKNIFLSSILPTDKENVKETIVDGSRKGPVITFGGDEYSTCKVAGFTIINGSADNGGGIMGNNTHATLENNDITSNTARNYGGGVFEFQGIIQRNYISNNKAGISGGGLYNCGGMVQNNFIYGNAASQYGGGIAGCNGAFQNNTVYSNLAGIQGGGSYNSNIQLKNCIFWYNDAPAYPEIFYTQSPSNSPLNCCIENWTGPGTSIVLGNPKFVNPNIGNLHLQRLSSCIEKGCDIAGLTDDIDSDIRPIVVSPRVANHYDIGADEYKNKSPQIIIVTPEANERYFSKSYNIQWKVNDVDCEGSTSLYLDTDKLNYDGALIVSGIKSGAPKMSYLFNTENAPEGIFHIYGKISDGYNAPSYAYSPGTIKISGVTADDLVNHLSKKNELPSNRLSFADFNNDGIIDIGDLVFLLRI